MSHINTVFSTKNDDKYDLNTLDHSACTVQGTEISCMWRVSEQGASHNSASVQALSLRNKKTIQYSL